eukprot:866340-Pleurochrysis_carterae.AAC.1
MASSGALESSTEHRSSPEMPPKATQVMPTACAPTSVARTLMLRESHTNSVGESARSPDANVTPSG